VGLSRLEARRGDPVPIGFAAHRTLVTTLIAILIAVGAVIYCYHYREEAPGVALYLEAARCMLDGLRLQGCNPTFTYPPIFALLMIPLVPLPMVLQNLAWYVLTFGSLVGCFMVSAPLARRLVPSQWSERDLAALYGLGILVSLNFVFAAIASQSYDAVVVLLVVAGLAALADGRPAAGGASLAGAAALKATPILFLPYLVVKRRYLAAAVMVAVFAVASLLPDLIFTIGRKPAESSYFLAWFGQVAGPALTEKLADNPHTFWFGSNPNNLSLRGVVGAFFDDNDPQFKFFFYALAAVYCAVVAFVILRSRGRQALVIDSALLLISMLMLSPMSSPSHYVALIPPMVAVAALWLKGDGATRKAAGVLLVATLVLTNATSRDLVGAAATAWAKQHRLMIVDALLLAAFFAMLAVRPPAGAGTPSAIGRSADASAADPVSGAPATAGPAQPW
jgi:alpha-1,2-mannosyltransferase